MINANGVEGKDIWGKRAPWVDYSATIDGEKIGLAIFQGANAYLRRAMEPYLNAIGSTPKIIFLPIIFLAVVLGLVSTLLQKYLTDQAKMIRTIVGDIRIMGRNTQGVRLVNLVYRHLATEGERRFIRQQVGQLFKQVGASVPGADKEYHDVADRLLRGEKMDSVEADLRAKSEQQIAQDKKSNTTKD